MTKYQKLGCQIIRTQLLKIVHAEKQKDRKAAYDYINSDECLKLMELMGIQHTEYVQRVAKELYETGHNKRFNADTVYF